MPYSPSLPPTIRPKHASVLLAALLVMAGCGCGSGSGGGGSGPIVGTLVISGTLGPAATAAGARVSLEGPVRRSTAADGGGAYSFTSLPAGQYTVTPSEAGLAFSPTNQPVSLSADATGIDFVAAPFVENLTVDGSASFQTIAGMGVNINVNSWNNGQLRSALDALAATAGSGDGASLFRVIRDPMTWVMNESDIPALHARNAITMSRIYETQPMRDLWNTIAYLNAKGIRGRQIILNFMGWTPVWLGGSGTFGVPSAITPGKEGEFATMVASLVYYGRNQKRLDFTLLAPLNEPDWNCLEGPCVAPAQYATILADLVTELDAMGLTDVRLVAADAASLGAGDGYIASFMGDAAVAARVDPLGLHVYGGSTGPRTAYAGHDYWLTETAASCANCDDAGTPAQGEWAFASETGDDVLADLEAGLAAVCVYDGYDSYYYHHASFGYWGLLAYDQGTGRYTRRRRFYVNAQINGFIRPGAVRLGETHPAALSHLVAFVHPTSGKITIVGHNPTASTITLMGRLQSLTAPGSLSIYTTDSGSRSLQRGADVPVSSGEFVVDVPGDSFFSLTN